MDRSGVAEELEALMPTGGRPRQLPCKTILLGMLFAIDAGRPAHLEAGHEALMELALKDKVRLGVTVTRTGALCDATYRQFSATHRTMVSSVDPAPVPSFKGVDENTRVAHLSAARHGVEHEVAEARLSGVLDALVEASVPSRYTARSSSLAVDWTDYETWSRPRGKDDPKPANDPTASWGHAKRNAPGAKDCLFFGYYAQVATIVADEGGLKVPELVRRVAFGAPAADPAALMASTLARAFSGAVAPGDVLADCGYSNRQPETFALPLRRAGASLVVDLHPADRGPRGTHEGAICSNGSLYCPQTPAALLALSPLARDATDEETTAHDARAAELARYKLGRVSKNDRDGAHRVMCPAVMGKVRCPLRPESMALGYNRPEVFSPPEHPPTCCVQKTVTVPVTISAKTTQKHDYPSKAHRLSYNRRTGAERTFAWMQDPATGGMRRGWSRIFGRAPNALLFTLRVVVRNVRLVLAHEGREAEEARRQSTGLGPQKRKRRRRRQGSLEQTTDESLLDTAPQTPG